MSRALNVFKMRGSWHDKGIREYTITGGGPDIKDSFRNLGADYQWLTHPDLCR
jgi:circadian clock protein KaiC